MIARMFKSPQLENKFIAFFGTKKNEKTEGSKLIQGLKGMKL